MSNVQEQTSELANLVQVSKELAALVQRGATALDRLGNDVQAAIDRSRAPLEQAARLMDQTVGAMQRALAEIDAGMQKQADTLHVGYQALQRFVEVPELQAQLGELERLELESKRLHQIVIHIVPGKIVPGKRNPSPSTSE